MAKKRHREPDIVRQLQEDARWSSYTNSEIRGLWRIRAGAGTARLGRPGSRTVRLVALVLL